MRSVNASKQAPSPLTTTATMSSPFANYPVPERSFIPANPAARPSATPTRGTGAKRGRKPKNAGLVTESARTSPQANSPTSSQPTPLQWASIQSPATASAFPEAGSSTSINSGDQQLSSQTGGIISLPGVIVTPQGAAGDTSSPRTAGPNGGVPGEEDGEGEDEFLPAMADDDYSAQLSWQSQSKDNLKCAFCLLAPFRPYLPCTQSPDGQFHGPAI